MEKIFGEYKIDMNTPCNEFNCAFDAGSVANADYVLYSSLTIFQNYYILNLNLVDISVTKVIWSENGEVPIKAGENPGKALLSRLRQIIQKLHPADLKKSDTQVKGTLGILNLSPDSEHSKILFDRLSTDVYTSGVYNLVDEAELNFILESQGIQPSHISPTKDTLLSIGKKLGVDYLIFSLLKKELNALNLRLALFDINKQRLVRDWPYRSSNFSKLLKFESKFLSKITQPDIPVTSPIPTPTFPIWKRIAFPASIVAGGVLGYMAWRQHKRGNEKYEEWQDANQSNIWEKIQQQPRLKSEVEQARLNRNVFGIMGSILLSGSVVIITF
jgi:hypothetical protein